MQCRSGAIEPGSSRAIEPVVQPAATSEEKLSSHRAGSSRAIDRRPSAALDLKVTPLFACSARMMSAMRSPLIWSKGLDAREKQRTASSEPHHEASRPGLHGRGPSNGSEEIENVDPAGGPR